MMSRVTFTVELVGKVGTEDVDGEVVIPYCKIFDIYFKNLPEENQKIGVNLTHDPNLSGSRLFTSATVRHAASLLPLARSMMLLKDAVNDAPNKTSMADRVPSCLGAKSAELVPGSRLHYFSSDVSKIIDKTFQRFGDAGASMEKIEPGHAILVECKSRLLSMMKEFINQSIQEFSKVKELAVAKLEGASSDFKLDNVKDSESLEFALISKACADPRFHQLHSLCQVGGGALSDLRMKLKQLSASCKVFFGDDSKDVISWAEAGIADINSFVDGDSNTKHTLQSIGSVIGTVTLTQSLYRDLKTGETRQGLVHRALQATKRLGFECNKSLVKKCEGIVTGKPASRN